MEDQAVARRELWGWLIPGLGLAAVGVFGILNGGSTYGALVILAGLALCLVGVAKHERVKRGSHSQSG